MTRPLTFVFDAGYTPGKVLTAPPSSQPPRTTPQPQPLFTPQQQTTNANVSSVFSSTINRAAPSDVQERIQFYSRSAAENFQPRSEEMGRKLETLQLLSKDLENPKINTPLLIQKLKDCIGPYFYKICEEFSQAMTGNRNAQTGERLLQDNFRNIMRVKDWYGRNLLEQVAAYYAYQNENFRGRAGLCQLGEMLERHADLLVQTRKKEPHCLRRLEPSKRKR
jgi:hypothetical protein